MRRLSRFVQLTLAGALLTLSAPRAFGQPIPCTDGMAGEYPCTDLDLYAHVPNADFGSTSANDIWGWTDPQSGKEYAIIGLRDGAGMVDVTDPANPIILGKIPTSTEPSVWRDIKVYDNHVFIVSEAPSHGMQVYDLTQLRGLSEDPERVIEPDLTYTGTEDQPLGGVHNIVMNEDSGYAYAVGTDECAGGLYTINVQDPLNPIFEGCFDEDGYTHDAQCVTYHGPDSDYTGHEICVNSNEDTITVVDMTDKANPVMLGKGEYPTPGYTHQGWLTEDHRYFLSDDELDEIQGFVTNTRTMIFDLADLSAPELIGIHNSENTSADHNMYVVGNTLYQANYTSGLRVLDISRIADGVLTNTAAFDVYPETDAAQFNGSWSVYPFFASGTIVISGMEGGLFVVRTSSSEMMTLASLNAIESDGAATVTWSPAGSASASFTLQARHEDGGFLTVGQIGANGPYRVDVPALSPGTHEFRLIQYVGGTIRISDVVSVEVEPPSVYRLSDVFTDAETETVRVALTVAESQNVHMDLMDADGNLVKTIFNDTLEANQTRTFEVAGPGLESGSYTLHVTGDSFSESVWLSQ